MSYSSIDVFKIAALFLLQLLFLHSFSFRIRSDLHVVKHSHRVECKYFDLDTKETLYRVCIYCKKKILEFATSYKPFLSFITG